MRGHITPVEDVLLHREQCLTVNMFCPHGIRGKLSVAVYVHGGAYNPGRLSILYTHTCMAIFTESESIDALRSLNGRLVQRAID